VLWVGVALGIVIIFAVRVLLKRYAARRGDSGYRTRKMAWRLDQPQSVAVTNRRRPRAGRNPKDGGARGRTGTRPRAPPVPAGM
jgi:hypothetical protein